MTQERVLLSSKLGEDGLPVVVVGKHELDPIQVPETVYEGVVTYDNVWYHHSQEVDCVSYIDFEELDKIRSSFDELRRGFIERAMATGHYKNVDLVLNSDGCSVYAIYYGHPTIEEVVQAKEYHRQTINNLERNVSHYTDMLEQSKKFLEKMGE